MCVCASLNGRGIYLDSDNRGVLIEFDAIPGTDSRVPKDRTPRRFPHVQEDSANCLAIVQIAGTQIWPPGKCDMSHPKHRSAL